jgi:CcmD family protein
MNKLKHFLSLLVFTFISRISIAQGTAVEMADQLRQSGKIYVVVLVVLIIFIGIIVYMIYLDRKMSKMEEKIKEK